MDVLNKFCSTVSSTVSQLSAALPGNPVTREFEATEHIASVGQGLLWKVYSGYKKSTRQEVSILVLEKKQLERWQRNEREIILETLRRGIAQLTRLRHPQVLVVCHALEESRDSLAFATEPILASLANVLGVHENMPTPLPAQLKNYKLLEIEVKYGLLQIGEGLAFLHNDAKLLHRNICPENIIINQQGAWKLFGFEFCAPNSSDKHDMACAFRSDLPPIASPNIDYIAPECVTSETQSSASDVFSLGILTYAVHNDGRPLFSPSDIHGYRRNMSELKSLPSSKLINIPPGLRDVVKLMLSTTPELRPEIHDFIKVDFFEDVGVKTLNYLDSLFQWDNLQKSQFYKGLPQVIEKLPHRVCIYRIVPCLVKEFVNPTMVPFVLPNVLSIAESSTKEEFVHHILPHLKPVMKLQEPIQTLLIFMQKMELLLNLTPADEIKSDVLPMLYRALESDVQQIQELCLAALPTFASLIDYPSMKNALLPRIKRLCVSTSYISVRVNCLVCLGKLLEFLDKWLVLDEVLPFLPQIPSREPAVLMGILGIYKLVLNHKKMTVSKEVMATKIIPFLMPLSIENSLTLNQFNALISIIKEMVNRVEAEHRVKLEQLNSIQSQQSAMNPSSKASQNVSSAEPFSLEQILGMNGNQQKSDDNKFKSNTSETLTFQDKQRLVQQQDVQKRLQSEPVLSPTPAPQKAPPQVRDLTASLIENNLSQMSFSQHSNPPQSNFPSNQSTMNLGSTGFSSFSQTPALLPATQPAFMSSQMRPQATSSQFPSLPNLPQNNLSQPGFNFLSMNATAQSPLNSSMISPMNTFPSIKSTPSMSMNNTFLNNSMNSQPTKPLSSSEIDDFLS
nr:PREDICTED: SCY1-like protein 2 isoform X1 [Bemisia tabaci]XP_018915597.1 PREDICTED: SCY1-like protein 2 isoform X1 [Bemisia tabaci]XP_018915598.1 PREDICTED: SCY1-like protein 2 isoform X1 [Bemisia tabaci]XP_018915599.1 PREDICTED: SCY1-like protein 2 isoform X1 [Bemisia tabaci]